MSELVLLKLGGSLITDKRLRETPRPALIARLGAEIATALRARPEMRLVLGHGSGSFGHFAAQEYGIQSGQLADWRGYAEVSAAAQRLNRLVTDSMLAQGVPVASVQPSASARCRDGRLEQLALEPVSGLLQHGLVPLVYGDIAMDETRGCTIISTEQVFVYLGRRLHPQRILMVGEVAGVYSADPQREPGARLLREITPGSLAEVEAGLGGSFGVDVTGGMLDKVRTLLALVREQPGLTARILSGQREGLVREALLDADLAEGTLLHG